MLPSRNAAALILAVMVSPAVWTLPETLGFEGRKALIVTALAVIGWTMTRLPDSIVAISAALTLVLTGTLVDDQFFSALGAELV